MPLALRTIPVENQFKKYCSVLFVACNICPRMHFVWKNQEPLFSLARLLGRKDCFQRYILQLRENMKKDGLKSDEFITSPMTAMCLWTTRLAKKFKRRAVDYEAIGVIGCESAVRTISRIFPQKHIEQLMQVEGIANFTQQIEFSLTIKFIAAAQVPICFIDPEKSRIKKI